jgi:hypothetical protein
MKNPWSSDSVRTAENRALSRIARASSKRQKELMKPGPCTVLKYQEGHLVEILVEKGAPIESVDRLKAIAEPKKHWTPERLHKDAAVEVVVPTMEQADLAQALEVA